MTNSSDEASSLRLIAFGSPRLCITTSGRTHSIGPGKPLALVTFLAFAPRRTATRETLCDILWGDRPVELCRPALRQTLWLVKTQIDSSLLAATADGVSLARDISSDVEQFAAAIEANNLEGAVELYAGDFFSGYAAPGARRFEEWANLERTRFQALFVQASESLARRAIDSGRFGDAIQLARRLRSADTNGQVGWRLLLEARIASGDLIDARADADHFEEWLRQEEWDPEPASRSLLKLAREASTARDADVDSDILVSELVGREREFAMINDAWSEAQTRGARIVHILAESGHGKTRLTRDVLARIRVSRGAVHYIKANYGEREIPYSFAAAIAESIASSPGAGGVAPAAANTLVSLNPVLSASYSQSSRVPEQLEPLRVGLALLDLLTAVAEEEPLALALDDLHWSDPHSREALTIVLSRIKPVNLLVIATARPQYIVTSTGYERLEIRLAHLEQDEVTSLITSIARLPQEPWALRLPVVLAQSSGGSPFQILETLHYCLDTDLLSRVDEEWQCKDIPAMMQALEQHGSIDRRMATLSAAENAVLLALGIAGMPTKRNIVVKASELTGHVADEAAANLEVRGMLVADGDAWSLAHDAIAEAVLTNAEPDVQEAMHARLGAAMARDDDSTSRRRAIPHLAEANDWKRVADSAAPFVRNRASTTSEVDVELGRLLGTSASNSAVARVRGQLPLTVRQPKLLRRVLMIGAVLIGAALVYFAIVRSRRDKSSETTLMATSMDANVGFLTRSAVLDRDRWEASSPRRRDSSKHADETWPPIP